MNAKDSEYNIFDDWLDLPRSRVPVQFRILWFYLVREIIDGMFLAGRRFKSTMKGAL